MIKGHAERLYTESEYELMMELTIIVSENKHDTKRCVQKLLQFISKNDALKNLEESKKAAAAARAREHYINIAKQFKDKEDELRTVASLARKNRLEQDDEQEKTDSEKAYAKTKTLDPTLGTFKRVKELEDLEAEKDRSKAIEHESLTRESTDEKLKEFFRNVDWNPKNKCIPMSERIANKVIRMKEGEQIPQTDEMEKKEEEAPSEVDIRRRLNHLLTLLAKHGEPV